MVLTGSAEKRIDEMVRRFCSEIDPLDPLYVVLEREGALRGMQEHAAPANPGHSGLCRHVGSIMRLRTGIHTHACTSFIPLSDISAQGNSAHLLD